MPLATKEVEHGRFDGHGVIVETETIEVMLMGHWPKLHPTCQDMPRCISTLPTNGKA